MYRWDYKKIQDKLSKKKDPQYKRPEEKNVEFEREVLEVFGAIKVANKYHGTDCMPVDGYRERRDDDGNLIGVDVFGCSLKTSITNSGKGLFISRGNVDAAHMLKDHVDHYYFIYGLPNGQWVYVDLLDELKYNAPMEILNNSWGIHVDHNRWKRMME
jgi:hypothetical protein